MNECAEYFHDSALGTSTGRVWVRLSKRDGHPMALDTGDRNRGSEPDTMSDFYTIVAEAVDDYGSRLFSVELPTFDYEHDESESTVRIVMNGHLDRGDWEHGQVYEVS